MSAVKPLRTLTASVPVLLTAPEAASLLRVKVSTIYVWTSKRKIPFRKAGGRLRFDRDEILRWTVPR